MSTMLQDAIIDAEALKEAALKNAETAILEKSYSKLCFVAIWYSVSLYTAYKYLLR